MICVVQGCTTQVDRPRIMCTFHWSLVSRETKLRIWAVCEAGMGPPFRGASASEVWVRCVSEACKEAIQGDLRQPALK